ncbi:MAG: DUF2339 domain-containing protein, partial [Gaiellaceae bacterium]
MTTILERLDRMEDDVRRLDLALSDLREEVARSEQRAPVPAPTLHATPAPQPDPRPAQPVARPVAPRAFEPVTPRKPSFWSREALLPRLEAADLLGARGLAIAGGFVTLLGVVFFFALAAGNGWIGPVARVVLGAAASAIVFGAGVYAHARYGRVHAAVAAAGAGIAGGYATLLFAAARYELVPPLGALALAALIAAIAVALSLRWSSEIVAGFGLIGAMAVPAVALLDAEGTATGTAFVALVFLGAAIVGISRRWHALLLAAGAVSVPQLLILVGDEGEPARAGVLAVATAFFLLYLGTGVVQQVRAVGQRLDALAGAFAGGNVALTLVASFVLLDGNARAVALAAATLIYGALAVWAWEREPELSAVAAAAGSALGAVAFAQFLDGPALVVAWAAETIALAWLGRRIADARFQLLALGYLGLALAYTILEEAPLWTLYERGADFTAGVPALLAVAVGAAGYGLLARAWPEPRGLETMPAFVRGLVDGVTQLRPVLSRGSLVLAGVLAIDAASLAILDLFEWMNVEPAFDWGHVAVSGLWALAALSVLTIGLRRRSLLLEVGGLAGLAAALLSFATFTIDELEPVRGWAALLLAFAWAAAALSHGLLARRLTVVPPLAVAAGAILSTYASVDLLAEDLRGYGLLAAAGAHAAVAIAVWRRRDLATCFWVAGLALGLGAAALLVEHSWLVLALAAAGAALAAAGRTVREPRLWLASGSMAVLAAAYALGELAPPEDFFRASATP